MVPGFRCQMDTDFINSAKCYGEKAVLALGGVHVIQAGRADTFSISLSSQVLTVIGTPTLSVAH